MKKVLISSLLIFAFAFGMQARQISESEALSKAKTFMSKSSMKSVKHATLKLAHKETAESAADYYVFNRGENEGFIIVSGSDKTDAVIGYSDNGSFDAASVPDNMKALLESYVAQIKEAESGNYTSPVEVKAGNSVKPLLGNITWGQDSPFNDKCPVMKNGRRAASGCVATAFAQVMYYYGWPAKGSGSNSYVSESNRFSLSADFGATTYRWDLMTPTYGRSSSAESRDAVATLLSHFGIAAFMDYGEASGTHTQDGAKALYKNFNYDKGVKLIMRDYSTGKEWVSIIKNELDNNRPVVYGAQSNQGGHEFVLDGYDENGLFHVNWGWDGISNGYFKITILDPEVQGTGGSLSGFYYQHDAVIGIQTPTTGTEEHPGYLLMDSFVADSKYITKGNNIRFTVNNFFNYGYGNFKGKFGFGFFNEAGELVAVSSEYSDREMKRFRGFSIESSLQQLPSEIAPGTYRILPIMKMAGNKNWEKAGLNYKAKTTYAEVDEKGMKFIQNPYAPKLKVTNLKQDKAFKNVPVSVSFEIENLGDEYYDMIYVGVYNSSFQLVYKGLGSIESISNGEKIKVSSTEKYTMNEGNYKLAVLDATNNKICEPVDFQLFGTPHVDLALVDASFPDPDNVPNSNIILNVSVKNNGDFYRGDLYANVYQLSGGKAVDQWKAEMVIEEGQTANVEVKAASILPLGKYKVNFFYFNNETNRQAMMMPIKFVEFTLVEGAGVESVVEDNNILSIYPNPVEDVLHLSVNGAVESVQVFSMTGIKVIDTVETEINVSDLAAGNYFVKAVVDGKVTVKQFIKK